MPKVLCSGEGKFGSDVLCPQDNKTLLLQYHHICSSDRPEEQYASESASSKPQTINHKNKNTCLIIPAAQLFHRIRREGKRRKKQPFPLRFHVISAFLILSCPSFSLSVKITFPQVSSKRIASMAKSGSCLLAQSCLCEPDWAGQLEHSAQFLQCNFFSFVSNYWCCILH